MGLGSDLLEQARHLAALDQRRPKQASLRRALSTAYCAAFHLLVEDASRRLCPNGSAALANRMARAFTHGEMKQVCRAVQSGADAFALRLLQPAGFSPELQLVASTFYLLQEERHRADYDLTAIFLRVKVLETVDRAEALFQTWEAIRASDEANVFCAALLLGTRWAK